MRKRPNTPQPEDGFIVPRKPAPPDALPAGRDYGQGYGYGYDAYDDDAGGGLMEYWRILMRRKGLLILAGFLGGLAGFLYTLPQTPIYKASASMEIQQLNPHFMDMSRVNPVQEGGNYWNNQDIQTQINIMQSTSMMERVMAKLEKTRPQDYALDTGRLSAWRRALNLPQPEPEDAWETALGMASGSVSIQPQGDTRIVTISVDSTDPEMAATFANTLAEEYIEQNLESRWQMTQRTSEWLTRQLEEMRIKLERSEEALNAYARRAGLVYTAEQGSVAEDKLRQLQQALSAAQADRVAKQSRYELVRTATPESLPDVLNDNTLREYQRTLTNLRSQDADLATVFTAEHSSRKRLLAQIATVEAALSRERDAILERIRNDYEEARRREKLLADDYAGQTELVTDQTGKSIQYSILKREVESNRQLYETMLERVKSASVASALRASNVRVVDPARAPLGPYKPQPMRNAMMGFLLAGFFGVVIVIFRERMDRSLQDPGDASYFLNIPELGVIPAAGAKNFLGVKYRKKSKGDDDEAAAEAESQPVELVTWKRQPSPIAESFRAALTSILFSSQNGARPNVLTITSANPSEGKTTIASNLAIALAEVNQRVLLVDGDLRKPRLHDIFNLAKEGGLSEILKDRTPVAEMQLNGSIRQTEVENLWVLPAGEKSHGSTNLLYSARMSDLLEKFEQEYDMVLIDTPPMMHIPDARIIGRMSDGVILVIKAGETTRDTAQAVRQRFAEDGTKVLGSILNNWDPKKSTGSRYGYYYADRYRYYSKYYQ